MYSAIKITKDTIQEIVKNNRGLEKYLYPLIHDLVSAAEDSDVLYVIKIDRSDDSDIDYLTVNGRVFARVYQFVEPTENHSQWNEITKI